jgi:purine-nucleoside/S-methyl-5'-thioadenosine phosphorylase / adenosine deaminase
MPMMWGIIIYMPLPELTAGFKWIEAARGPALVCETLEPYADHFFTTRAWLLGASGDVEGTSGWREVAECIGVGSDDLVRVRQVHGAAVVVHKNEARRSGDGLSEADILVTNMPSVALAIQTADCVPLLIADRRTGAVAAAHAGWRGLAARVPHRAVEALGREYDSRPADLVAAIGPSISAPRYEVGRDVWARFEQSGWSGEEMTRWFRDADRRDHWYFDGWRAAREQLMAAGVAESDVHSSSLCTASYPDILCSYRRDGKRAGRIAAVVRARPRAVAVRSARNRQ